MDKVGKKIVRNLKSRRYEVMEGANNPERIETLQIERFSPDSYNNHTYSNGNKNDEHLNGGGKGRPLGNEIEMTAAVSGVVPDGMLAIYIMLLATIPIPCVHYEELWNFGVFQIHSRCHRLLMP